MGGRGKGVVREVGEPEERGREKNERTKGREKREKESE